MPEVEIVACFSWVYPTISSFKAYGSSKGYSVSLKAGDWSLGFVLLSGP